MTQNITIALLSGGIDSATAAALAIEANKEVIGLSFNYGQRHHKELDCAKEIASFLGIKEHHIIDMQLSSWGGSSLTDMEQSIHIDGIVKDKIPNTYVPGRNTIFIAMGLSLAEARGANQIALGINAMDYSGYPDCRPDYIHAYQKLAKLSNKAGREGKVINLWAPLLHWKKVKIIQEALRLNIPIQSTWSCYSGEENPCGKCDSCRIRDAALKEAGRPDLCSNLNP